MAAPEPDVKILFVRVPGGEVPPVPALAPKVGPLKLVKPSSQLSVDVDAHHHAPLARYTFPPWYGLHTQ